MSELALLVAAAAALVAFVAVARAAALARRLDALEREVALARDSAPASAPAAAPDPAAAHHPEGAPAPAAAPDPEREAPVAPDAPILEPLAPVEPPRSVEATIGLTWATRVGGALLLAGVAFFFKHAVEREWLGPWARVGLGAAVGALALAAAVHLRGRASAAWVDVLAGVALAILLVTAWASHALYELVEPAVAFVACAAVIAVGGVLAVRFSSEALLVTATLGGLANPTALAAAVEGPALHFAYLVLVVAAALVIATPRRWPWATAAAALGGSALACAWYLMVPDPTELTSLDRLLALAGVAMFANALTLAALRWPVGLMRAGLIGLAATALSTALAALAPAGADALLFAGLLLIALALVALRERRDTTPANLLAFAAGAAALLARGVAPEASSLLLVGVWSAIYVVDAARATARASGSATPGQELLLWQLALPGVAFCGLALEATDLEHRGLLAAAAGAMAVAYLLVAWALTRAVARSGAAVAAVVALGFAAALAPLLLDGAPVVLAWSALAVVAALAAARSRLARLDEAALVVLGLAAVHLAWVDWPAADLALDELYLTGVATAPLLPPSGLGDRGLALFGLGAGALGFAAASGRADAIRFVRAGVASRFVGLGLLAAWLATEAALLVDRGALAGAPMDVAVVFDRLEGAASLRAIAVTLTLGGYGAAVLAWGFVRQRVHWRWFGLGLLSLVVIKLVAVDLWDFDAVARTVILIVFGALLLASGFLYARFGARLRGILRDAPGPRDPA